MTQPELLRLTPDRPFPNNEVPVRLYRDVVSGDDLASELEALFSRNGWQGLWRDGIRDRHHFHSTAYEVLGCARGTVDVLLGGPNGETVTLNAGDCAMLPPGTSHKNVGSSDGFLIVGGYPPGQNPDFEFGDEQPYETYLANIGRVPAPQRDPVSGHRFDIL